MNKDQINSFVRSAAKIVGSILVARGMTNAAAIVNTEDCIGLVIAVVGLVMSHFNHSQISPAIKP